MILPLQIWLHDGSYALRWHSESLLAVVMHIAHVVTARRHDAILMDHKGELEHLQSFCRQRFQHPD